jgi:hypothetical protein
VNSARTTFALFVAGLGICAILGGVITMEPGWVAKARQDDVQREQDLRAIVSAIVYFRNQEKALPYDLSKLAETTQKWAGPLPLADPETGQAYDFARIGSQSYKLCATFKLASLPLQSASGQAASRDPYRSWLHPAGSHCFVFDDQSPTPIFDATHGQAKL